jgi:23S rRNA (uridine2552-2'-O)-methyltransferase
MSGDVPEVERKRLVRAPTGGTSAGRGLGARVKTADHKTLSSQRWLQRQLNDPFVKAARAHGYRARAAYKLTEIDERFHLIRPGFRVVDLGCAPGGWLQVALERGAGQVVGVDLLEIEPLVGAEAFVGDFGDPEVRRLLLDRLGGAADLVLSDMAPNTLGHRKTDHLRIVTLIEAAADFAVETLRPKGAFVAKAFQGGETAAVIRLLKSRFEAVRHVKPKASRSDSSEVFLVATGFRA